MIKMKTESLTHLYKIEITLLLPHEKVLTVNTCLEHTFKN